MSSRSRKRKAIEREQVADLSARMAEERRRQFVALSRTRNEARERAIGDPRRCGKCGHHCHEGFNTKGDRGCPCTPVREAWKEARYDEAGRRDGTDLVIARCRCETCFCDECKHKTKLRERDSDMGKDKGDKGKNKGDKGKKLPLEKAREVLVKMTWKCPLCKKTFKGHHIGPHKQHCGKSKKRKRKTQKRYDCCGKVFYGNGAIGQHRRYHPKKNAPEPVEVVEEVTDPPVTERVEVEITERLETQVVERTKEAAGVGEEISAELLQTIADNLRQFDENIAFAQVLLNDEIAAKKEYIKQLEVVPRRDGSEGNGA